MTAITAITAQNTLGVSAVQALPPALVAAQIAAVFADPGVDAVKIGMLADAGIIAAVADCLFAVPRVPVVLDPVMIAKSGDLLLEADAVDLLQRLFPLTTLLTPNLPEAERLAGSPARTAAARESLARRLGERCAAVLLKGGHAEGKRSSTSSGMGPACTPSFIPGSPAEPPTARVAPCRRPSRRGSGAARAWSLRSPAPSTGCTRRSPARYRSAPAVGPVDPFWQQRRRGIPGEGGGCLA